MIEFEYIMSGFLISLAIAAGIIAAVRGSVSLTVFYIWLGIVILSRIQVLIAISKQW